MILRGFLLIRDPPDWIEINQIALLVIFLWIITLYIGYPSRRFIKPLSFHAHKLSLVSVFSRAKHLSSPVRTERFVFNRT